MKLYLARHGRTNYNDLRLCNADPTVDVHLTSVGLEQANALANRFKEIRFERIFVSELKRAQQTAIIINEFHDVPVEIAPLLNDHRSGFEGKSVDLLVNALDASENKWTARFNDGESIEDMKARVAAFLDQLRAKPYDITLVVTSQWIIYAAVAIIRNVPNEEAWKLEVEPGSCLELNI
jgi:probable phosphoglycerate mutase